MSTARYQQVADALRERIRDGTHAVGETLPTIEETAAAHNVARDTARAAYKLLEAEGLAKLIRHRGTIVQNWRAVPLRPNRYQDVLQPGGTRGPWETACHQAGVEGNMRLLEVAWDVAPAIVATALEIDEGAPVVRRSRQAELIHDSTVDIVSIQHAWYPPAVAGGTQLERFEKVEGGVYGYLTSIGRQPETVRERLRARRGTPAETAELGLRDGVVLITERTTRDASGELIEHLTVIADATRWEPVCTFSLARGIILP